MQLPLLCLGVMTQNSEAAAVSTTEQFEASLREAIRLGGCNVSRSIFVGACVAALEESPPPKTWMERFGDDRLKEVERLAKALADVGM